MTGGVFITIFSFSTEGHRDALGTESPLPRGDVIVIPGSDIRHMRLYEIHEVYPANGAVTYHTLERKGVIYGHLQ